MIAEAMTRIGKELLIAYPIPVLLAVLAWAPGGGVKGFLFSAHGGAAWLLLLLSFPWLTGRILALCIATRAGSGLARFRQALLVLIGYFPLSVLCAYSFTLALNPPLSNTMRNLLPWFYFPLSLGVDGW
jgi:hypothetical protein